VTDVVKLKRVLVLMEFADGSIGAVYSEGLVDDAHASVQRVEEPVRARQDELYTARSRPPVYRLTIGDLTSMVAHDPGFHDPAVESMALAVMDQWRVEL
jgi:hypothetical protein